MEKQKTIIKMAGQIRQSLLDLQKQQYIQIYQQLKEYLNKLTELTSQTLMLGKSLEKSWYCAADICQERIKRSLNDISYTIQRLKQFTDREQTKVPTLNTIFDEIQQLEMEFEKVQFNNNSQRTISVITAPVSLEDFYFGPFEIILHTDRLRDLYKDSPYFVVALDSHPAATSEDVTHPHVSNERLCEGEGYASIRIALEQGRLIDFFTMVISILNTYNPDSPYVSLQDWEGISCYDCGYTINRDDCYYCERCQNDFCSECSTYCRDCEETICMGCVGSCQICDDYICPSCIKQCSECEIYCCENCLNDGLCSECQQSIKDNENEKEQENNTEGKDNYPRTVTSAGTSVQSDSVGQASVLQR